MTYEFRSGNWFQLLGIVAFVSVFFVSGLFVIPVEEGFPWFPLLFTVIPSVFLFAFTWSMKTEKWLITHDSITHQKGKQEDTYFFAELGRLSKDVIIERDSDGDRTKKELFRLFDTTGAEVAEWSPSSLGTRHNRRLFVHAMKQAHPALQLDGDCEKMLQTFVKERAKKAVDTSSIHAFLDTVPTPLLALISFAVPLFAVVRHFL